ncbi:MAG: hypothetical protein KTR31_17635 [Myxococcales bacterium]|nr:hypothetical protein [Myxococcales bacterium]
MDFGLGTVYAELHVPANTRFPWLVVFSRASNNLDAWLWGPEYGWISDVNGNGANFSVAVTPGATYYL